MVTDIDKLGRDWRALYSQSEDNVYLSWQWISRWMAMQSQCLILLKAHENEKLVGMALFASTTYKLAKVFSISQLWLHRHGDQSLDQIWIEQNQFLVSSHNSSQICAAMLDFLNSTALKWDELHIGVSNKSTLSLFKSRFSLHNIEVESLSYRVNLTHIMSLNEYVAQLSRNTRSQISRSKRLLEEEGQLTLTLANTLADKQEYLSDIAKIHRKRWQHTTFGSGFDNPKFTQFHESSIFEDNENTYYRLYRLALNKTVLGYVYLILGSKGWNFYLSAINYHENKKIKVGMVMHCLIIEQAILAKQKYYHFLAGDAQYKQSLSNEPPEVQQMICFYRPTIIMKFRERLRAIKRWWPNT
jgi:CelD/BcsL family acetyltransferase involved in cellulose biosynthesis